MTERERGAGSQNLCDVSFPRLGAGIIVRIVSLFGGVILCKIGDSFLKYEYTSYERDSY